MYGLFIGLWGVAILLVMPILIIRIIIRLIKKKFNIKDFIPVGICFWVSVICFFGAIFTAPEDIQTETPITTEQVKTTEFKIDPPTTTEPHTHKYVEVESTPNISLREMIIKSACSCGKTKTQNVPMTSIELSSYLKENCETYTFEEIARNPDTYKGKLAVFTGEVIQVQEVWGTTTVLVNITKAGNEYYSYYTDTVYVNYKYADDLKLLDGDTITMYGELQGEQKYLTVLGQYVSVPLITVYYAELN
jgi:hypothetical protein